MRTPSQVHRMEEAGFSSFSEGTGSDVPPVFFLDQDRNRMKRNQSKETNLEKTRTTCTILPEPPEDDSHISLQERVWSSKEQTPHI